MRTFGRKRVNLGKFAYFWEKMGNFAYLCAKTRTFGRKRAKKGDFAYLCAKILSSLRNRKKGLFFVRTFGRKVRTFGRKVRTFGRKVRTFGRKPPPKTPINKGFEGCCKFPLILIIIIILISDRKIRLSRPDGRSRFFSRIAKMGAAA